MGSFRDMTNVFHAITMIRLVRIICIMRMLVRIFRIHNRRRFWGRPTCLESFFSANTKLNMQIFVDEDKPQII